MVVILVRRPVCRHVATPDAMGPQGAATRPAISRLPKATTLSMVLTRKSHGHQAGGSEPGPVIVGWGRARRVWLGGFGVDDDGLAVADSDGLTRNSHGQQAGGSGPGPV